jgi:hypothetical protein
MSRSICYKICSCFRPKTDHDDDDVIDDVENAPQVPSTLNDDRFHLEGSFRSNEWDRQWTRRKSITELCDR